MKYSFDDWLQHSFVMERYPDGTCMFNDSSKYTYLCMTGKLDYEVLNQIQNSQAEAYETMVCNEYVYRKKLYNESSAMRPDDVKAVTVDELSQFFTQNKNIYKTIITNRQTRGIPFGAKFVPAKWTIQPLQIPSIQGMVVNTIDRHIFDPDRMFAGEIDYLIMDAKVRLKDDIEGRIVGKKFPFHYFNKMTGLYDLQYIEDQFIRFHGKLTRENGNYRWIGSQYECAAYIDFLFDSSILNRRHEKGTRGDLASRYGVDLKQQKPGKVKIWEDTHGREFIRLLNNLIAQIPK